MKNPQYLTIAEAGLLLREGSTTSLELTEHLLARIGSLDPAVNAFVRVTSERAREDAIRADEEFAAGIDRGPMHGIPYGMKDIFATAGIATTCHSKLRLNHIPTEDADVVTRLTAGGAVLVGKLATHEFALGGPSFDLPFPPARNPWNLEHFTGASSSGSAAAVAAGFLPMALGSDTSGSIRGPAFHCGTVGFKPTYGLVSRRGVFPLSYSLDHVGPLTWTVEDAALVMEVIAGHDPLDPSSVDVPVPDYRSVIGRDIAGLRIGYPRHMFADAETTSPEVVRSVDGAAAALADLGATVEEVALPEFDLFNACGRIIMTAEMFAVHESDLKTRPLEFGRYTYQRIAPGAALSAADLIQALRLRQELTSIVNDRVLAGYDALVTACALAPAARFDEFPVDWPPPAEVTATQTIPFNVTGNPALAVPAGFSSTGLPIGIQIVGRAFDELTVLQIGAAYQDARQLYATRPDLELAAGTTATPQETP